MNPKPPISSATKLDKSDLEGLYIKDLEKVIDLYKKSINYNPKNVVFIEEAWDFCKLHHKNQLRADKVTPYYFHPLTVAYYVALWGFGYKTIIAALLHDLVEDVNISIIEIEKKFGKTVAFLVKTVTKINVFPEELKDKVINFDDVNLYTIILGMAEDFRVIVIKLADRLHNMQTIQFLSIEKQRKIAKNTLEVYVPIAVRIGLQKTADTLKDLIFKVLNPEEYNQVKELVAKTLKARKKNIQRLIVLFKNLLDSKDIKYIDVFGRPKTFYSIFRKMQSKYHNFNNIYDLDALRIITYSKQDCYLILGAIHEKYIPIFSRFKDYIAAPKPNMYQSLHTSIMMDKNIVEVQIRTKEMDEIAEYGIAAHWLYKEGETGTNRDNHVKLSFFKKYIDFSFLDEMPVEEVINLIKTEVLKSSVYAITPKGDTYTFPKGATVLDFAYRIHSKIGDTAIGGYVNGIYCSLHYQLKTGDIVEIKTSPHATPTEEWLKKVKTSSALSKIKKTLNALKTAENETLIAKGKKRFQSFFNKNPELKKIFQEEHEIFHQKLHLSHIGTIEKFYYGIGLGTININNFFNELFNEINKQRTKAQQNLEKIILNQEPSKPLNLPKSDSGFFDFKNIDNLKYSIAKCCLPIPYDDIIGVISAKHGVAIHHKNCPNIKELVEKNMKIIPIKWKKHNLGQQKFSTKIKIECLDRANLLNDIIVIFAKSKINIENIFGKKYHKNVFIIKLKISISSNKEFEDIKEKLMKKIKDIFSVTRILN